MNEKKKKKPLLSYEQVVDMIEKRIASEEGEEVPDERIVRVERAAEELEAKYKKRWGVKKKLCAFKRFWRRLYWYCKR